jgi:3-methyl-2-oxobutanoate hydroxymethyltransferase
MDPAATRGATPTVSNNKIVDAGYGRPHVREASDPSQSSRPVTVPQIRGHKGGTPLVMVTAYDATFARMLDEAGADILLVGDSLGMVVQGNDDTLSVTVDDIVYHCRAVSRGARRAHIVGDMPFLSYQVTAEEALRNAGRIVAQGRAHAVKLEGGRAVAPTIERIVGAGVPVMAHVGLTPQAVHAMGGFKVQGTAERDAERILDDARAVADAGAYALVLEGIPGPLAQRITEAVPIPTIGIGAGVHCDGQVLVCYDLLGLTPNLKPKFVKGYDNLFERGVAAVRSYCDEVRSRAFPGPEHTFGLRKPRPVASTG